MLFVKKLEKEFEKREKQEYHDYSREEARRK